MLSDARSFAAASASGRCPPVITVDGPAAAGKGTVAKKLAQLLSFHYLDSGKLYRAVAAEALRRGIKITDGTAAPRAGAKINTKLYAMRPGGADDIAAAGDAAFTDITESRAAVNPPQRAAAGAGDDEIAAIISELAAPPHDLPRRLRSPALNADDIGAAASRIAARPAVRAALIPLQRAARRAPGLVADGRDMGTVVFPDAALKIYLTADLVARAQRRLEQSRKNKINATIESVLADLEQRDERDRNREVAPLRCPDDAIRMDSTGVTADDIVFTLTQLTTKLFGKK